VHDTVSYLTFRVPPVIFVIAGRTRPGVSCGWKGACMMAALDWSQCRAVESVPGKRSGAWVFRGTRTPVSAIFENLQDMTVDELVEEFGVTREQVQTVLDFVAHSTEADVA
jgi:uncharacterized protein (DUF433 family)